MDGKALFYYDVVGIPALRDACGRGFLWIAVGENRGTVVAVLLLSMLTAFASSATVHHTADTGMVTDLELGHVLTDRRDDSGNLVPRNLRIFLRTPVAAKLVNV